MDSDAIFNMLGQPKGWLFLSQKGILPLALPLKKAIIALKSLHRKVTFVKKAKQDILNGPLFPNIISYTVPIILTSVLQLLFNAADLVIVGRFRGSASVGAVGATVSLTMLIINLFVGISVGAGVCVAHAIGSRQEKMLHRIVHTALPTALLSGVILTAIGFPLCETFLKLMDTPKDILPLSTIYMKIYFCGMTFTMVYNFCSAILRAAGDTKSPLLFLSISGVLNVGLNIFFVTVCDMNVEGVALATVISQAVSAGLVVLALRRRKDGCHLSLRKMRFYLPQLRRMLRIGLPAGLQSSLFAISNVTIQSSINSFGDVVVAGNAAAGNLDGFLYVSINAFSQTAMTFTGQNVGAGQYHRVKSILWRCCLCAALTGVVGGILLYSFGRPLLGIYITDSAQAIEYGLIRLTYISLPYFLCGLMDATTGTMRGMGASLTPMIISVLGVCGLRIGWIATLFQLPRFHTLEFLYLSYPVSWIITFAIQLVAFAILYRNLLKRANSLDGQSA